MPYRNVLLTRKSCKIISRSMCHGTQGKKHSRSTLEEPELSPKPLPNNDSPGLSALFASKKKNILWSLLSRR